MAAAGAYVPEVDTHRYEDRLAEKVTRVKRLFADFERLPEVEVCGVFISCLLSRRWV
jgi:hypothetical protein